MSSYRISFYFSFLAANSAFLVSQNMLEAAAAYYRCNPNEIKQFMDKDRDGNEIGVSFLNEFRGRDIKTATGGFRKKIQALGPDSFHKFDWNKPSGEKVKITIKDYLKQQYNIDLKYQCFFL